MKVTFFKTYEDNGFPHMTLHVGTLEDGTFVGWGPWQKIDDARPLSKSEIEYWGIRQKKRCPTCGQEIE